jgi:hypothetical protein
VKVEPADVPAGLVTETLTPPAECAGAVTVSCVDELTETDVPAVPPKETVDPGTKFAPEIATVAPPEDKPKFGESEAIEGAPYAYMSLTEVVEDPNELETVTSTVPVPAGACALSCVAEMRVTDVPMLAPKETVSPEEKFVPLIVTTFPPAEEPAAGLSDVTVGFPVANRSAVDVADVLPDVVTVIATDPVKFAGETAVMLVAELNVTEVAAVPPKLTVASLAKFAPVISTEVPAEPTAGDIAVTVGGAMNV